MDPNPEVLSVLFENYPDVILLYDKSGTNIDCNQKGITLFSFTRGRVENHAPLSATYLRHALVDRIPKTRAGYPLLLSRTLGLKWLSGGLRADEIPHSAWFFAVVDA